MADLNATIPVGATLANNVSGGPIVRVKDVWNDENVSLTELLNQGSTPGRGVQSMVNYYKASSSKPSAVDPTSDPIASGWSLTSPELTETANVRWWFMRITYTDNTVSQSDIVEIGKLNQEAQIDYDEVNRRVAAQIETSLAAANTRLTAAEDRLDSLETEDEGIIERLETVEARKVYTDDEIKALAEVVVNGKGYITLAAFTKDVTKGILTTAGLNVDAVNAVVDASADYATKNEVSTVGTRVSALETSASTYATKTEVTGAVNDARTEWTAADKAAITSAVTAGHKVLVKDGVYSEYAYDPTNYASITAYENAMIAAGYTIKVITEEMSTIKQEADKVSILVGEDGAVKAGVVVDAINEGTVTINANRINLEGYVTAETLEATSKAILNSVEAKKLKITTNSGMDISIDPENGFVMTGEDGALLYIDIKEGSPTLYMKDTAGESFYLNPSVWVSLSGATSFTAKIVSTQNNNGGNPFNPTADVTIYKGNDQKYYSATSSSSVIASGTYYSCEILPAVLDPSKFDGKLWRETLTGYAQMTSANLLWDFYVLRWKKLTIADGVASEQLNGYTSLMTWQNGSSNNVYLLPGVFTFSIDSDDEMHTITGVVGGSKEIASTYTAYVTSLTNENFTSSFTLATITNAVSGTTLSYTHNGPVTLGAGSQLSVKDSKLVLTNSSDNS